MDLQALQQVGLQHAAVRHVLDVQRNTAPNPQRLVAIEGLWAHKLALSAGTAIETFFWCPEAAYATETPARADEISGRAARTLRVSTKVAARLSERDRPDGLVSLVRLPHWTPAGVRLGATGLVLVADGLEIPGNVGTLLRVLDACAADALVLTNRRVRLTHPKLFRASQGSVLTVPVLEFASVEEASSWLASNGVDVWLADTADSEVYRSVGYGRRIAFVVGSERYGISAQWYAHATSRVRVPMLGRADSLNVAVSAAVLLYEARAQQAGW